MRVLEIMNKLESGGVEAVLWNYLSRIDDIDFEIAITSTSTNSIFKEKFEAAGIPLLYLSDRKTNPIKHIIECFRLLRHGKYDCVHCHINNWSWMYLTLAKLSKIPVRIGHSHLGYQQNEKHKPYTNGIRGLLLKQSATDMFACGKEAGERMWGEQNMNSGDVVIMRNAVEINAYAYDVGARSKVRKELGISQETLVLINIGRLSDQKNQHYLIECVKKINPSQDWKLLIVGKGPMEEELRSQIVTNGLSDNVSLLGARDDIPALLSAADVFIFPSIGEGFPVVLVEAQLSGLPCLISDQVSTESALTDQAKFLPLDNPDLWVHMIEEIQRGDREQRYQRAQWGISASGYDIDREKEVLSAYYKKAVLR